MGPLDRLRLDPLLNEVTRQDRRNSRPEFPILKTSG
jgi:hypothetical protein